MAAVIDGIVLARVICHVCRTGKIDQSTGFVQA